MKNNKYWQDRMVILEEAQLQKGEKYLEELDQQYKKASRNIEKELSGWYQRFAANNKISMTEARKLLSVDQLKEFQWDVNEYIKYGELNALDQSWMKELENASARVHISRLESLKLQLQQQVEVLYGNQLDGIDDLMRDIYRDGYYRTAWEVQRGFNVGWDLHKLDDDLLGKFMSKPWTLDKRTFSDHLWTNKTAMVNDLQTYLTQSVITGKAPDQIIKAMAGKFNTDRNKAGRLVMTESAAFASISKQQAFKDLDVEQYEIVATLDNNTSKICQDLDGHIEDMANYEVGITAPPFHPWCRTTTAPYFDDEFALGERAARGEDGETYYVPSDMKYPDWKKTFIDGAPKTGLKIVNAGDIMEVVKGIDDLQTPEEVEDLMKQQDWFYKKTLPDGTLFRSDDALSFKGVDLESAKEIYKAHETIFNKYPQLIGELNAVNAAPLGKYTMANCSYGFGRGGITVNSKWYYNDHVKFAKKYAESVDIGHSPKGTDWTAVVTHELGHAIDDYLSNTLKVMGLKKNGYQVKEVSAELRRTVMRSNKMTLYDVRKEVSDYATKTHYEWFAEAFAEYIHSPSPRVIASDLGKRLDEIMEGVD